MTQFEHYYLLAFCISTAFQSLATVGIISTFIVYYFQLRKMGQQLDVARKAMKTQNALTLINYLQAPDVHEARFKLNLYCNAIKGQTSQTLHETYKEWASKVCSTYDVAGIIIKLGFVPEELFLDSWGPSIKSCFEISETFITDF